jgi:hypothetical protein
MAGTELKLDMVLKRSRPMFALNTELDVNVIYDASYNVLIDLHDIISMTKRD